MNRFVELIPKQCAKYGEREALRFRDYETQVWASITWQDFAHQIDLELEAGESKEDAARREKKRNARKARRRTGR